MSGSLAGLLGANALLFAAGLGLLPILGVAGSLGELAVRAGLAYFAGLALGGILAATLALVGVSFGWPALGLLAAVSLVFGGLRLRLVTRDGGGDRPRLGGRDFVVTCASCVGLAVLFVQAGLAFAVKPLVDYDSWAIWGMRGRALAVLGSADPRLLEAPYVAHPRYPLLVPSLEAIGFRAMGSIDFQLVHLQFLLIGAAGIAALAALLWDRVPALVLWPTLVALATAPAVLGQLLTAYADVPLALFVAVGAAAATRWLVSEERWPLHVATLMFAAALLTKSEGTLFVLSAYVALALTCGRRRLVDVGASALTALAAIAPWWAFIALHGLKEDDYRLTDAVRLTYVADRAGRGAAAFHAMLDHMLTVSEWSLLVPLFATGLAFAVLARVWRAAAFAVVLCGASLIGLGITYAISALPLDYLIVTSAYRVVATVVLSGAAVTPLLVAEAWRSRTDVSYRARRRRGRRSMPRR